MRDQLAFGPFLLLEKGARERLGSIAAVLSLKQGDVLIEERSVDDDAYLLVDGSLRVVARGEERTLALIGAPALVGEMAVVQGQGRSATVLADTPATVLRLPARELRRLIEEQPLFGSAMRERTDLLVPWTPARDRRGRVRRHARTATDVVGGRRRDTTDRLVGVRRAARRGRASGRWPAHRAR